MDLTEPIIDEQIALAERNQRAKKFAMEAIAPYFIDPTTCGIDESNHCQYLTDDGRMCVLGKHLIDPSTAHPGTSAYSLLGDNQIVLKPEYRDILSRGQWGALQSIHDSLAASLSDNAKLTPEECIRRYKSAIQELKLFTYEELMEYVEGVKNSNYEHSAE